MVYKEGTLSQLYHLLLIAILLLMFAVFRLTESMCGRPGTTPNCEYNVESPAYRVGETVTYYCKHNPCYTPYSMHRNCLANGSWSGVIPFCHKRSTIEDIDELLLISGNSTMNANSTMDRKNSTCITTNTEANIYWEATLKKSFKVIALKILFSDRITDTYTGVKLLDKSGTVSSCEYRGPQTDRNLHLFVCPHGVNANNIQIIPNRRQKSEEFSICEVYLFLQSSQVSACLRPDMPYQSRGLRMINPSKYVFECNENYEPLGDDSVICRDGTWSQSSFKCQRRIGCEKLPEVANGVLRSNSTTINSTAWLECNEGFRPLSDYLAYCLPTEKWTTLSFICELIKCDPNPEIPHGKAELPNGYYYGSKLHITCDQGYIAVESQLRECRKNGSWENLNICTQTICGPLKFEDTDTGQWVSLNETISIRVLICQTGYHIVGSPAVTQCLPNGSWSYSTAVCRKTPKFDAWNNEWTPSTILLSAVAVGAGTAICILCLAMCFLVLKKRRQKSTNSSVFHVGVNDSILYHEHSKEQANFKANTYEDVIELRNNPSSTKPRKPSSALPNLPTFPVDTDPVYAQPFETSTAYSKVMPVNTSADIYTAHIYAEPVDSHNSNPSGPGTFTSAAETWLKSGAKKFGRKMSLPGRATLPEDSIQSISKNIEPNPKTVFEPSNISSLSRKVDEKQKIVDYEPKITTAFTELINNSIYLDTKEGRFTSNKDTEQLQMIDNDIYQDDYFSNV